MKDHKINVIISYCSNDFAFLYHNIKQVEYFADKIIVVCCDSFFNGEKEVKGHLSYLAKRFKKCFFIEFPYVEKIANENSKFFKKIKPVKFWHSLSRFLGYSCVDKDAEYLFFLDADEIVEGKLFKEWLDSGKYKDADALMFSCYWYFRDPKYRATQLEEISLLINKTKLNAPFFFNNDERNGYFNEIKTNKINHQKNDDNKIMIHHFSWVRTKEQLLKKAKTWGHKDDRDWESLINKHINNKKFNLTDFVHNYNYVKVENPFIELDLNEKIPYDKNEIISANYLRLSEVQLKFLIKRIKISFFKKRIINKIMHR